MAKRRKRESWSEILKAAIIGSGAYLTDLSQQSGLSVPSISRFVNGERSLQLDSAEKLAECLELFLVTSKKRKDAMSDYMSNVQWLEREGHPPLMEENCEQIDGHVSNLAWLEREGYGVPDEEESAQLQIDVDNLVYMEQQGYASMLDEQESAQLQIDVDNLQYIEREGYAFDDESKKAAREHAENIRLIRENE